MCPSRSLWRRALQDRFSQHTSDLQDQDQDQDRFFGPKTDGLRPHHWHPGACIDAVLLQDGLLCVLQYHFRLIRVYSSYCRSMCKQGAKIRKSSRTVIASHKARRLRVRRLLVIRLRPTTPFTICHTLVVLRWALEIRMTLINSGCSICRSPFITYILDVRNIQLCVTQPSTEELSVSITAMYFSNVVINCNSFQWL